MHNHCTLWLGVGVAFYSSLKHSHMFRISLSLTKHFSLLFSGDGFDNDLNRIGTNTNKCTHTELLRNEYGPVVYAKWKQCNQTNNKKAVKSTFQCVYEYVCVLFASTPFIPTHLVAAPTATAATAVLLLLFFYRCTFSDRIRTHKISLGCVYRSFFQFGLCLSPFHAKPSQAKPSHAIAVYSSVLCIRFYCNHCMLKPYTITHNVY